MTSMYVLDEAHRNCRSEIHAARLARLMEQSHLVSDVPERSFHVGSFCLLRMLQSWWRPVMRGPITWLQEISIISGNG